MANQENKKHGFGFALDYSGQGAAVRQVTLPKRERMNRTAIGLGMAAVLVCTGLLAPQISAVFANDDSGSAGFFLQESKSRYTQPRQPTQQWGTALQLAPLKASNGYRRLASASAKSGSSEFAGALGNRSVCVRLCDGYFFPVGDNKSTADLEAQEMTCNSVCPGAPTKLYLMPSGSDKIEDAVSLHESKRYAALPVALRYTNTSDRTCSCKAETRSSSVALLKDITLRKGDGVMTPKGVKVFRGAQHWPYKRNDFLSLAEAENLTGTDRGALAAIERAAKGFRPAVAKAQASPSAPAKVNAAPLRLRKDANGRDIRVVGPQAMLEQ